MKKSIAANCFSGQPRCTSGLAKGEANLPKRSVVNVTQIATINKTDLTEKIGALSPGRTRQVLAGIYLVLEPEDFE